MIKKQVQESREKQIKINKKRKKKKKKIIVKIFSGYNRKLNEKSDSDKKKTFFPNMPVRRQTRIFQNLMILKLKTESSIFPKIQP